MTLAVFTLTLLRLLVEFVVIPLLIRACLVRGQPIRFVFLNAATVGVKAARSLARRRS